MQPLAPMLAVAGEPFDSPDHLFEIKWDGIRCLAGVERTGVHLWGRGQADYTARYPELEGLRQLPSGTILDGELVRFHAGRADFPAVLRRHQLTSPRKIRWAAGQRPVTYMVFDLLKWDGQCLLRQSLQERRTRLDELRAAFRLERMHLSEGVTGAGEAFFDAVIEQQHEGVMAKRLDSRYLPGKRAASWQKIKPQCDVICVVIGYTTRRKGRLRSLLLAADDGGSLRYVGGLGRGLSSSLQSELAPLLSRRRCAKPVISCSKKAHWVRPEICVRVRCFGWSPNGHLRFPYLGGLLKAVR